MTKVLPRPFLNWLKLSPHSEWNAFIQHQSRGHINSFNAWHAFLQLCCLSELKSKLKLLLSKVGVWQLVLSCCSGYKDYTQAGQWVQFPMASVFWEESSKLVVQSVSEILYNIFMVRQLPPLHPLLMIEIQNNSTLFQSPLSISSFVLV